MAQEQARVFLAYPHTGQVVADSLMAAWQASRSHAVHLVPHASSLLTYNFNRLWAEALNKRAAWGLTHFAMLHSDVVPQYGWLDVLLEEQARVGVQVLSAVIPLKDGRGLTSTAVFYPEAQRVLRLTLAEVHTFHPTFGHAGVIQHGGLLLLNTGCFVCDFTQPWVEDVHFWWTDTIVRGPAGTFQAQVMPEDWNFSLWCHGHQVSLAATRAVAVEHHGLAEYSNQTVWGTWQTDQEGVR